MNRQITVIGAGISGLTLAYWLSKSDHDVLLLEKNNYAGGTMETEISDGFLFDRGPNSGLETTPLIREIVDDIGLTDEMVYASSEAKKRYILRHNTLWALPTGPGTFLNTKLFSKRAKLRLLAEPFIPKNSTDGEGYDTTVASFVRRRLGQEFLDYAVSPFISGVFAGDPEKLSIKSALPRLYNLEEQYGGLIKGMIKGKRERKKSGETSKQHARMFSFLHGMQSFPQAISRSLKDKPVYEAEVVAVRPIKKNIDGYTVIYNKDNKQY